MTFAVAESGVPPGLAISKLLVAVQLPDVDVNVAIWVPAAKPLYACAEVSVAPPSKLITPATLPVKVTEPSAALQAVTGLIKLGVSVTGEGLSETG